MDPRIRTKCYYRTTLLSEGRWDHCCQVHGCHVINAHSVYDGECPPIPPIFPQQRPDGPGTRLHNRILRWFGHGPESTCHCDAHIAQMNVWGEEGCRERLDEIVAWITEEARKRNWWTRLATTIPGATFTLRQFVLGAIGNTAPDDLRDFFERVYVISLDRRPDRYEAFRKRIAECDWPFRFPEKFSAIDGKLVPHPQQWKVGGGAWGCLQSHLAIIQKCLNENVESVLILEDDATPAPDFAARCREYLAELPAGWEMAYFGGQFLGVPNHPPVKMSEHVCIPHNVNRTHAYALSTTGMQTAYLHLQQQGWWGPKMHIDHRYGVLHERRDHAVYCPTKWLMGQGEGRSDVCGRQYEDERTWQIQEARFQAPDAPFFAIVGLHSSGSSAIAGVCYHLGMHLGDKLGGFYGNDPETTCGFEAVGLAWICERLAPFPRASIVDRCQGKRRFRNWINRASRRAREKGTIAGAKYPHLCRLGLWLREILGDRLRVIHCVRPLQDSIASLAKRGGSPGCSPEEAAAVQGWLQGGKEELLASLPEASKLDVDFYELLQEPKMVITRIAAFIGTNPSEEQIAKAIAYVQPERQHVGK